MIHKIVSHSWINWILFIGIWSSIGCGKEPESPSSPQTVLQPVESSGQDVSDQKIEKVMGLLSLVKGEYKDAVRDQNIVDPIEYQETEMFLEQAMDQVVLMKSALETKNAKSYQDIQETLLKISEIVSAKGSPNDVFSRVDTIMPALEGFLSGKMPGIILGHMQASAKADAMILAEQVESEYRIGIFTLPVHSFFQRKEASLIEEKPAPQDTHFLGIVLRERRTKRFLPAAQISIRLTNEKNFQIKRDLSWLWGEFEQYGANVALPEGNFHAHVSIKPLAYHRHGDMLMPYTTPVEVNFSGRFMDGRVSFEGPKVTPVDTDYKQGADILQATTEAREIKEVGDYKIGFIAEAPEPFWLWKENKTELKPVKEGDTNHLEIALFDRESNQIITGANVSLKLIHQKDKTEIHAPLYPLLSSFFHYGETLKVAPGEYIVHVTVHPPRFGLFSRGRFETPVETSFGWMKE